MARIDPSAVALAVVAILYPLVAMIAVRTIGPGWVVGGLCVLLALRVLLGWFKPAPMSLTIALICVGAAMGLTALYNQELSVRLYPAFMNLAMLAAFARTLVRGPSMIERFARIMEPNLPNSGVRYTRKVTMIWVGFFAVNGAIAVWTALFADWHTWTLYNGLIAYIAMGALFGGEFIVRHFVREKAHP